MGKKHHTERFLSNHSIKHCFAHFFFLIQMCQYCCECIKKLDVQQPFFPFRSLKMRIFCLNCSTEIATTKTLLLIFKSMTLFIDFTFDVNDFCLCSCFFFGSVLLFWCPSWVMTNWERGDYNLMGKISHKKCYHSSRLIRLCVGWEEWIFFNINQVKLPKLLTRMNGIFAHSRECQ